MHTAVPTRPLRTSRPQLPRTGIMLLAVNAVALVGLLGVLFAIPLRGSTLRLGEVAGETVVALHRVTYINHVATQAKKKQASEKIGPAYNYIPSAAKQSEQNATGFFTQAEPIIALNISPVDKLSRLQKLLPTGSQSSKLTQFTTITPDDFKVVRDRTVQLLAQASAWHFPFSQLPSTKMALLNTISAAVTPVQRTAVGEVLSVFLKPTLYVDANRTYERRQQAAAKVATVIGTIYPGEVIIRRGDIVTRSAMDKLAALGIQQPRTGWQQVVASVIFSSAMVAMLFWYLHAFHTSVVSNPRLLVFIDISILVTVALVRFLSPDHILLPYFLPVAAAPTFAAVLLGPEAAIAVGLCMSILVGWISANSFELAAYYFLTSAAGILGVRHVQRLKQFILAGCCIMIFALPTLLAYGLVDRTFDFAALQDFTMAAVTNGFLSSALALGGFALLAGYFGVTTSLHLLELAGPNQELVRRLMTKAPGTYNHSLILGSMVEHAAQEIGADSLVARVGAIYHDIGKTANPHCFVENQLGIGNIHDELQPEESARLIRGHVIQGLRLARQHRLPRVVLDAIAEHHGTMSIAYFLHRAREYSDEPIDISLYTYPGPKPQSKETALIMLADGCEAAVRASNDRSSERIREIVDQVFTERIDMGQLSESPLTLHDLARTREAFLNVLTGLYHPRIEYPEPSNTPIHIRGRGIAR